jgi:hypothetical protein
MLELQKKEDEKIIKAVGEAIEKVIENG